MSQFHVIAGAVPAGQPSPEASRDGKGIGQPVDFARAQALLQLKLSSPIVGTIAEKYLNARALDLPAEPSPLRCTGEVRMLDGSYHPAMIAQIAVPATGEVIACQKTALTADGSWKAAIEIAKATVGKSSGGAVAFGDLNAAQPNGKRWLVEAEGVETLLSCTQATGLAGIATLSNSTLGKPLLPHPATIIIAADRGAEVHAQAAAQRRIEQGHQVRIAMPPDGFKDFNEVLMKLGKAKGSGLILLALRHVVRIDPAPAPQHQPQKLNTIKHGDAIPPRQIPQ